MRRLPGGPGTRAVRLPPPTLSFLAVGEPLWGAARSGPLPWEDYENSRHPYQAVGVPGIHSLDRYLTTFPEPRSVLVGLTALSWREKRGEISRRKKQCRPKNWG